MGGEEPKVVEKEAVGRQIRKSKKRKGERDSTVLNDLLEERG